MIYLSPSLLSKIPNRLILPKMIIMEQLLINKQKTLMILRKKKEMNIMRIHHKKQRKNL